MWEEENDAVLWERSLSGDGEAFGVLFDRHRDRVFQHALRLAETRQDAEDTVASAFLVMWRRRREVRLVSGSVLPWLLVTTTNVGLNVLRSTRRYRRLVARLPRGSIAADPATLLVEEGPLGVDERLRAALRDLGETDRRIVALVILDGYPLADAADLVGVTPAAAKARLHRARGQMRDSMGEHLLPEQFRQIGGAQ